MKIICIGKGNDPRGFGGIETFERVLGRIFKTDIKFYTYNLNTEYLFSVENDIKNIQKTDSIIEKILLKILGKT